MSATFALGTAVGDLLAYSVRLGFLASGLVFAAMFAVPALGWNAVATFWLAYIVTRPIGASFAHWTGKAAAASGLSWGDGPVAVMLVVFLQLTHRDVDTTPDVRA